MSIFKFGFIKKHRVGVLAASVVVGASTLPNAMLAQETLIPFPCEPVPIDPLDARTAVPRDDCDQPGSPGTPPSITVPSSSSSGSFTVRWGRSSGYVTRYELSQLKTGTNRWFVVYNGTSLIRNLTAPDGSYRYRVRACNNSSCSGHRYSSTITVAARPGRPASIDYAGYSKTGNVKVSWGSSSGSNKTYTLEKQKNSGSWTAAYSGGARSKTLALDNGRYRFRVKACNTNGCSSFRYGNAMIANQPGARDLYAQYPYLSNDDAVNNQYARTAKIFRGEFQRRASSGDISFGTNTRTSDDDQPFFLGTGFDLLNGAYANFCLDHTHRDYRVVKNPSAKPDEFEVSYINTTSELFNKLQVTDSTGINFTYKSVSAGVDSNSERLTASLEGTHHEVFVVRLVENRESWSLNTQLDPIKADHVSNMLARADENGRTAFRQRCGDQFIANVDLGARLHLVFSYDARRFVTEDIASFNTQIDAGLKGSFDGSYSNSEVQEFKALLTRINASVTAFTLGGPDNIDKQITILNFNQKATEFVNGTKPENYRALKQHYRNYPQPTSLLSYGYYDIFTRFLPYLENVRRWNYLDAEREQRCKTLASYKESGGNHIDLNHCESMAQELQIAKDHCGKSEDRSNCLHPAAYYTAGTNNPNIPGILPQVNLYNELERKVDYLEARSAIDSHYRSVTGGVWNKKCITVDEDVCLTEGVDTDCFADIYQGNNLGTGKGFGLNMKDYHSPGSGGSQRHTVVNRSGETCLNSYVKACTRRIGGSKARINFDHEIFGRCAVKKPFSMVGS